MTLVANMDGLAGLFLFLFIYLLFFFFGLTEWSHNGSIASYACAAIAMLLVDKGGDISITNKMD